MRDCYDDYPYCERPRLKRSRCGLLAGVCQGISNWSGISVGIIRIAAIVSLVISGFFPIGLIYIILAIILPS